MRPMFVDTIVAEAGIDLPEGTAEDDATRSRAYQEWRRTRVLFLRSLDDVKPAAAPPAGDDLPAQRTGADL